MNSARRFWLPLSYIALLAAVNFSLARHLFFAEHTGHTNSIQGLWISMARLAGEHWFRPAWWPYQDAGVPFEHTYMPLVPAVSAVLAKIAAVPAPRAFYCVMGLVLVCGPVTLFVMLWRLSNAPSCAFWASLAYSLTSPARAVLPETNIDPVRYWSSLRLYGTVVWDDLPHQTAVVFLPLALLFLWRSLEERRPAYYLLTVVLFALTVLSSVFGATALLLGAVCVLLARPGALIASDIRLLLMLAGAAYVLVCPFLPPSLIATIRSNQQRFVEDRWSAGSFLALGIVALGAALLRKLLDRWKARPETRFFVLFAFISCAIPVIDAYLHLHFVPQPNRYTAEMEWGLALAAVPAFAWGWTRIPRRIAVALAIFLACVACERLPGLFRFADEATRPIDATQGIEYRVARWIDSEMPGQRVMVPGSIAQWFNVFSSTPQLSGASYSTTPNWNQHEAMKSVLTSFNPAEVELAVLWLKAFGVQAATAVGRESPEFWKGVSSTKFDGLLPVLWREQDTTIYRVPQRSTSLAHVIPAAAVAGGPDPTSLARYVAALDDPAMPLADLEWQGFRHISIRTTVVPGQVVSVQTGFHRGWHARAEGNSTTVRRDGLGMLVIEPVCAGPCTIQLDYDGGWEYLLCRAASALGWIVLAACTVRIAWRAYRPPRLRSRF